MDDRKTKPASRRVVGANQHHGQNSSIAAHTGQEVAGIFSYPPETSLCPRPAGKKPDAPQPGIEPQAKAARVFVGTNRGPTGSTLSRRRDRPCNRRIVSKQRRRIMLTKILAASALTIGLATAAMAQT
ncbi:hypothetical protein EN766_42295, partial [Mesorhizobium sp. M2A.F.Ca.ET.046.02.1.1]